MARIKTYCLGTNKSGKPCQNYALRGSRYCSIHQGQETGQDRVEMRQEQSVAGWVLAGILVVMMLISFAAGCEEAFFDWATQ